MTDDQQHLLEQLAQQWCWLQTTAALYAADPKEVVPLRRALDQLAHTIYMLREQLPAGGRIETDGMQEIRGHFG